VLTVLIYDRTKQHETAANISDHVGHSTFMVGKPIPTRKLAVQLISTAMDMAAGRGPWEKSSAVIIHGIEPGPTAKNTTKLSTDTTDKYDIQSIISWT